MSEIIRSIEAKQLRTDIPAIAVGDTVKVMGEGCGRQDGASSGFEGVVIAKRNGGIRETFTVRRVSYGIGVDARSPCILPVWAASPSSVTARCVAPSCTTCVLCRVVLRRSRKSSASEYGTGMRDVTTHSPELGNRTQKGKRSNLLSLFACVRILHFPTLASLNFTPPSYGWSKRSRGGNRNGKQRLFDFVSRYCRRTDGDVYLGVVGPVRTGKSTFITRLMELLVMPKIPEGARKERIADELPRAGRAEPS